MRQGPPIVAVDLGGTHTRVGLVDAHGAVVDRDVERTAVADQDPDDLVALMTSVAHGSGAVRAVVGLPGRVNYEEGRLEFAPNLPSHWPIHLTSERLSEATGLSVDIANDADLATVGEHRFGAGRGTSDMVYLTLSTGVGSGVILGNRLARGRRSLAEVGHTVIDRRADPGRRTLEESASGSALDRMAQAASLSARGHAVIESARAGDPVAASIWESIVAAAGVGVANLAHLYSPELIVVGGGLGLVGEALYGSLREALETFGPMAMPQPIRIVPAELGDDAGLIGVAGWTV